jgi:membrane-bound ClpP family serine protease
MTEWATVVSLIIVGLVLIVAEVIFVPGTTLVGLFGFIFLAIGVGLSFRYFGFETGWLTVGVSAAISGGVFYFAFKTNFWGRFALRKSMDSKVNEGEMERFKEGMEGITLSALRPAGKAELDNQQVEVRTLGAYVDSGTKVKIIRIVSHQIIVEPIT